MFLLMFADKEPEKSTPSTVGSTTSTMANPPGRIVNNGMLINIRENQSQSSRIVDNGILINVRENQSDNKKYTTH